MPHPHTRFRLHYMDDSGSAASGCASFTWLALAPEHWATAQQQWLAFRADLFKRHRIPPGARLHATDLAAGRGRPSLVRAFDLHALGPRIVREGLDVIGGIPGLTIGTVYRTGIDSSRAKYDLYEALVADLDAQLRRTAMLGMIFMDGDGSDRRYAGAHRRLDPATRHLVEEPVFRSAEHDQWVQMADFAAWTAFQAIVRNPLRRRTWNWYQRTVGRHDPSGPRPL